MPSTTRRTVLRAALGAGLLASVPTVQSRQSVRFETDWGERVLDAGSISDAAPIGDDRFVAVFDPYEDDRPDAVALDATGEQLWSWRLDYDQTASYRSFQSVTTAPDGGLLLAREAEGGDVGLVKLDGDQSLVWRETYDPSALDLTMVRPTPYRLIMLNAFGGTNGSTTEVFGFDLEDRSLAWTVDEFEEADTAYWAHAICPYANGCVIGGETLAGDAWVARIDDDGSVLWSETLGDDVLAVTDLLAAPSGHVIAVGERDADRDDAVWIAGLAATGDVAWATDEALGADESIGRPQIARDSEGGFVVAADLASHPGTAVASTDDRGAVGTSSLVRPVDGPVALDGLFSVDDALVQVGDFETDGAWAGRLTRTEVTPTPTDTQTATPSPTPSPTPTPTATETSETDESGASAETDAPTTEQTAEDGPGFGALSGLFGALGAGYLARRRSDDGSD